MPVKLKRTHRSDEYAPFEPLSSSPPPPPPLKKNGSYADSDILLPSVELIGLPSKKLDLLQKRRDILSNKLINLDQLIRNETQEINKKIQQRIDADKAIRDQLDPQTIPFSIYDNGTGVTRRRRQRRQRRRRQTRYK